MSKAEKAEKPASGKPASDKPAAEKGKKPKAEAAAEAPPKVEKPAPAPADPRLKVLKKFAGKFLPKGPLRERHKAIMTRWDSGPEHGGVTVDELKTLLDDWRKTRAKLSKVKA